MTPKYINAKTKSVFEENVKYGNVESEDIAFVNDSKEIYTHDEVYSFVNWTVLHVNVIKTSDAKIFTAKDGEFLYNIQ